MRGLDLSAIFEPTTLNAETSRDETMVIFDIEGRTVLYGVRLFILYSITFPVVMLRIRELYSFTLTRKRERPYSPRF
jgi:hypothetical protein